MADKGKSEQLKQVTKQEACELIELAVDEFTLLTRAFEMIAQACQPDSCDEDEELHLIDDSQASWSAMLH